MATTIVTARDLILTIATVNYDAQTTAATLVNAPVITTYQTLDGKAYKHIDDQWTLNLELLADWGVASSLFEAMWTAADSAPTQLWQCHSLPSLAQSLLVTSFQYFRPLAALLQKHKQILGRCLVDGTPADTFS
jgi:hypothetical protein